MEYLLARERSERDTLRGNVIEISLYSLASERSERDTLRVNAIEISLYLASERSERAQLCCVQSRFQIRTFIYICIYICGRTSTHTRMLGGT